MARSARTVSRSAEPGPAPTRWTRPRSRGANSGGMADLLGGGDQAGDLGAAGAAAGPGARGLAHGVDGGAARGDGGLDGADPHAAAGADRRAGLDRPARRAADQEGGAVLGGQRL